MGSTERRPLAEWAVLGIVAEGPTHGFAVARELAPDGSVGGLWTVPRPLVYRAISALEADGLLGRVGSSPGRAGPRRTIIAATSAGMEALERWLGTPVVHVRDARSELLVKLLLHHRAGRDAVALIAAQRRQLEPMLEGLREQLDAAEGFDRTVVRWRLSTTVALDLFLAEIEAAWEPSATKRGG